MSVPDEVNVVGRNTKAFYRLVPVSLNQVQKSFISSNSSFKKEIIVRMGPGYLSQICGRKQLTLLENKRLHHVITDMCIESLQASLKQMVNNVKNINQNYSQAKVDGLENTPCFLTIQLTL